MNRYWRYFGHLLYSIVVKFGSFEDFLFTIENSDLGPREAETKILLYRAGEQKFDLFSMLE